MFPGRLLFRGFHKASRTERYLTTLGIRREDPQRIWERRTPIIPEHVADLLRNGNDIKVQVESCARRCFSDYQYDQAGATIVSRLTRDVDVVLGIKEPPVDEVIGLNEAGGRKKTWMVFSHTHKGQVNKEALLSAFLAPGRHNTLIDYELLTAPMDDGPLKRVAAFGWYAGAVGAGEALSMTGIALLKKGIATPLLHLSRPYTFASILDYTNALAVTGQRIRQSQAVQGGKPIVIGITGTGNVSEGSRDMLDHVRVEWIPWEQLEKAATSDGLIGNNIYACAIPASAYFVNKDGSGYSREAYYANPQSHHSVFAERIAPYLTCLINGAGWQQGFPRIMTTQDLDRLTQTTSNNLVAVQDVTCDIGGNLEFVDQHTTIDRPCWEGPGGVLISSTDILPTELPIEASQHFSSRILPYVRQLLDPRSDSKGGIEDSLRRATIIDSGQLADQHAWLDPHASTPIKSHEGAVRDTRPTSSRKRVLLLGSGLVAGPAVEVFAARPDVQLYIASNNADEARGLVKNRGNVKTKRLDVGDQHALSAAINAADVVVSLLPAPMHVQVAKHCIEYGKHLVTASYVSPEMKALHQSAVESDVLLLGECGLDPGIDTMAAMRILDRVKREGRKVTSFVSWCGGLPEPVASNSPLAYKFSWSPRAVLTAALNDAKYKVDGEQVEIPGDDLLSSAFLDVQLWKALNLEGLANRDSLPYAEKYRLGPVDGLTDLFRGTLRYKGFSKLLNGFRLLGLLSQESLARKPETWEEFLTMVLSRKVGEKEVLGTSSVNEVMRAVLGNPADSVDALTWFGLLPGSQQRHNGVPIPDIPSQQPLDYFAYLLSRKLAYEPHERDLALLHHSFTLAPRYEGDQRSSSKVTASLLHYGTAEASAMSTTVGKTLAFAALRVLDGKVKGRGVTGPYEREIWEGVLDSLEEVGVRVQENWDSGKRDCDNGQFKALG